VLLNVGRLHHKKGLDLLPAVLSLLTENSWRMVFIGEPEDNSRLELQAQFVALGLTDRVHFCDLQTPEQLIGAYSGADLFLIPSRNENFGNVVIEAMACGCAVVLSDQTGVWDQVNDLPLATVLPREPAAWRACLEAKVRAGRQRQSDWMKSSAAVNERFDWRKTAAMMASFYTEILSRHDETTMSEPSL